MMKGLSIKEPWISMIASGEKTIETRTWRTTYSGQLLLVGSQKPKGRYSGMAACLVDLIECRPMWKRDEQAACCGVYDGAFAWMLENIRRIQPFPVKGRLGLYEITDREISKIKGVDYHFAMIIDGMELR